MTRYLEKHASAEPRVKTWASSMSDHVAYALLVYTGLQILFTVKAMSFGGSMILPYLGLAVLIAAIIPACRWFEKRWIKLDEAEAASPEYAGAFRRDLIGLWVLAVGLPFVLTGLFKGLAAALGY